MPLSPSTAEYVVNASVTLLSTGFGALLGWQLSERSARRARGEEREEARAERVRQREDEVAALLDETLLAVNAELPVFTGGKEAAQAIWETLQDWESAWSRSGILGDAELTDRIRAVGTALIMALLDAQHFDKAETYYVGRAVRNARRSLAAFRREEPLPPATFPPHADLGRLAPLRPTGRDDEKLWEWLEQHPEVDDSSATSAGA